MLYTNFLRSGNGNKYRNYSLIKRKVIVKRKHPFIFLFFWVNSSIFAISPIQTASNIHTVQLSKKGWNMSQPIIQLNGQEILSLSFDDFAFDTKNYQYSIYHCNSDWEVSDLMPTEYMKGFMPNPVLDYNYSFNTTFDYIHYTLDFPNDDIQIKISGNYIIKVFELGHEDKPILVRPFYVTESRISIIPRIKFTASASLRESMQQVSFKIQHPNFPINNPRDDIRVIIQQNGRLDNRNKDLKPLFIRENELDYDYIRENLFEGGNEYRWLDIRSTRFYAEHMEAINFYDPHYHFTLFPDKNQGDRSYFYREDFNGKYYIDVKENRDPEIEGDYVYVHFRLPVKAPITDGDIFISGALTDWMFSDKSKMNYNSETSQYEQTLLLKQGFYNYQYLVYEKGDRYADVRRFEGSYGQTENDYTIFVYYKSISDNYERLIGVKFANSLKYKMDL